MKSKEKKKDLHHHIVNGKCIRCGKSFKESLCNECNHLREEVKKVMYSKRVGFMYAVGDEDLLVGELVGLVEEEKKKSRTEALEEVKKRFVEKYHKRGKEMNVPYSEEDGKEFWQGYKEGYNQGLKDMLVDTYYLDKEFELKLKQ